jgi:tRNA dimethylallyltransferase
MEKSLMLKDNKNNIIILTGPTCSGKTEIAIKIAQYIPEIEIISSDSMQIYKYMDIGTAKPNGVILEHYKHHGIGIVDPSHNYDVMQYTKYAHQCITDILSRSKKPMIVGGTGLYIKSLINPIFEGPGRDQNIRSQLTELLEKKGNDYLFGRLKFHDPEYSKKISPNDTRRVIRALEVYYLTGKPFSYFHQSDANDYSKQLKYHYYIIGLAMNREKLNQKINHRVDLMIKKGLIEETEKLLKKYGYENTNAMKGLGYQQIVCYLQGNISREESIEMIKKETRRFAKRQMSWFKNQTKVDCWINLDDYKDVVECTKKIVGIMKSKGY